MQQGTPKPFLERLLEEGRRAGDLGWVQGGPAPNVCTVQVNGRTPGTYTGVITATVLVL